MGEGGGVVGNPPGYNCANWLFDLLYIALLQNEIIASVATIRRNTLGVNYSASVRSCGEYKITRSLHSCRKTNTVSKMRLAELQRMTHIKHDLSYTVHHVPPHEFGSVEVVDQSSWFVSFKTKIDQFWLLFMIRLGNRPI